MASHYHCHCHHLNSHPITITKNSCRCSCCTQSQHSLPPDLCPQSLPSYLHPPLQPHLYSPYFSPPYNAHHHQSYYYPPQPHHLKQQSRHHHQQEEEEQTQPTLSSLLCRVAALESSIRHHSSSASYSICDAAASTIQTHFRAFLVRRSRTLRQLKDLASIKSTLNILKSSVSENAHFDSQGLSRKAMDLLVKLDSIQGDDPMTRDGRRSISRELIRFMEFIDGVSVKRNELSSRFLKNVRLGGNGNKSRVLHSDHKMGTAECEDLGRYERELMKKLKSQIEKNRGFSRVSDEELGNPIVYSKCGVSQTKVKKSMSFADNGNVYRVHRSSHEPVSGGDCNSIDGSDSGETERGELMDNLCREVEEIGVSSKVTEDEEGGQSKDGGSSQGSDAERNMSTEDNYETWRHDQDENGSFLFSAPLPVKMESRGDLMNKRKIAEIVNQRDRTWFRS